MYSLNECLITRVRCSFGGDEVVIQYLLGKIRCNLESVSMRLALEYAFELVSTARTDARESLNNLLELRKFKWF